MKPTFASLSLLPLPFLFYLSSAIDCSPSSGNLTLKTAQDVAALNGCATFTGNIVIVADGLQDIILDGVRNITGSITAQNAAGLRSLSSKSLEAVQEITLQNLTLLSRVDLPVLQHFNRLIWKDLPALRTATVSTGKRPGVADLVSLSNTALENLDWLTWPAAQLNITRNANLTAFNLANDVVPKNTTVSIDNNPVLQAITFKSLSAVSGKLYVVGNNATKPLEFGKLATVEGNIEIAGTFNSIKMPSLREVTGTLISNSTDNINPFCDLLPPGPALFKGHIICKAGNVTKIIEPLAPSTPPSTTSSTPTSSPEAAPKPASDPPPSSKQASESGSDTKDSKGSKSLIFGIVIPSAFLGILLCAIGFLFYVRHRIRSKVREIVPRDPSFRSKRFSSDTYATTATSATRRSVGTAGVGAFYKPEGRRSYYGSSSASKGGARRHSQQHNNLYGASPVARNQEFGSGIGEAIPLLPTSISPIPTINLNSPSVPSTPTRPSAAPVADQISTHSRSRSPSPSARIPLLPGIRIESPPEDKNTPLSDVEAQEMKAEYEYIYRYGAVKHVVSEVEITSGSRPGSVASRASLVVGVGPGRGRGLEVRSVGVGKGRPGPPGWI